MGRVKCLECGKYFTCSHHCGLFRFCFCYDCDMAKPAWKDLCDKKEWRIA